MIPETESRFNREQKECLKLAVQGRESVVVARRAAIRRWLIPDRAMHRIQEKFDQAGEILLQRDFAAAVRLWRDALQECVTVLSQARQGWLGKLLIEKSSLDKTRRISERFDKIADSLLRIPTKGVQSRIWENLAPQGKRATTSSFSDRLRRLVVVTECPKIKSSLERFHPYIIGCEPENFFAEGDELIYWPQSSEPMLSGVELHAIFLTVSIVPYAFVLASFGPSRGDQFCWVQSRANNLVMSGASFNHLRRFGVLPPLGRGRICRFFRSSGAREPKAWSPETVLGQPVKVAGREVSGAARSSVDGGRLLHALKMIPLDAEESGKAKVFVLLSSLDIVNLDVDRIHRLIERLGHNYDVVTILSGSEFSLQEYRLREAMERFSVAVYDLSETVCEARHDIVLECLAQCYKPIAIFACLESQDSLARIISKRSPRESFSSQTELAVRVADELMKCAVEADIKTTRGEPADSVLYNFFERDMGVPKAGIFLVVSSPVDVGALDPGTLAVPDHDVRLKGKNSVVVHEYTPLSVLICSTGRASDLERSVHQCLALLTGPKDELLVLDRLRPPGIQGRLATLSLRFPRLRYLSLPRQSAATARNQGAALAVNEVLVFIDDEVVPFNEAFFEFHRLKHAAGSSAEACTCARVVWPVDPDFVVDTPLRHIRQGLRAFQESHAVLGETPWIHVSTSNLGVKRSIVGSWMEEGFWPEIGDSRMAALELTIRTHMVGRRLQVHSSNEVLGEYCKALSVTELLRRNVADGIAAARISIRHPAAVADLGIERVQASLRIPVEHASVSAASDCLSLLEGLKSLGNLLPFSDDLEHLREVRSALMELSYLQGFTIGSDEIEKNTPAAYATVLNQFFLRIPSFSDAIAGLGTR